MQIIETRLDFGPMRKRIETTAIVIHHSANRTWNVYDVHKYHKQQKKWSGIGYHFFIDKEGVVYRGRPEEYVGAHCLNNNNYTIGICAQGDYMIENMPQVQRDSIVELCRCLCGKYKIESIKGHKDLNPTKCPGDKFPLVELKNIINESKMSSDKKTYKVKTGDTLYKIAHDNAISVSELKRINNLASDTIYPEQLLKLN